MMNSIKRKIRTFRPDIVFKKFYNIAQDCKNYYSPMTFKYYQFLIYYLRCFIIGGLNVRQVFNLGLGSSFVSKEHIKQYSNLKKMKGIYNELSPISWRGIQAKGIFYKICKSLDLPIPQLYGIIFKNNMSVSYTNSSLVKREDLIAFIRNELPNEFVIKPNTGSLGEGLKIYTKTSRGILDGLGNLKNEQEIIEFIFSHKGSDSFIVQERLRNHPILLKIHPSEHLHSIRIMTLIDSTGQCKFLHSHLNVATGQEAASQLGNIKINISLNDGRLDFGIFVDKSKGGFKKINAHPETGQNFKEFKLPFWEEVLSLSKEAAFQFLPMRTLGWDIAITEKGVKLLETNIPYGPPYFFMPIDKFIENLTAMG